ncbi:MAG: 16S rRNA (cytosine(1402)-N(4))-methyltransferase RsmH [candidate division WOR-3 bacterium]|jgi:16S rRNA (cytosine1402-N4)-methyltransferase
MHKPVMVKEVIEFSNVKEDSIIIDGTFGFGGHSKAFSKIIKNGLIIGFEKNPQTYEIVKEEFKNYKNIIIFNTGYENMLEVIQELNLINKVDIVLFDLGLSSFLIEKSGLGFSYKRDEILDMRFNPNEGKPLYVVLESLTKEEISNILKNYGDVKNAYKISEAIKSSHIKTTKELCDAIKKVVPKNKQDKMFKKVFQAFRIYINDEINNLRKGILNAHKCLKVQGRLLVLSYHSIEDRVVKEFSKSIFFKPLFKKPITPSKEEILENPRSRSAKLRVLIKR